MCDSLCSIPATSQKIFYPRNICDVKAIVNNNCLGEITIVSGAHSYIEPKPNATILITTQIESQDLEYENDTVWVPAGVRMGQLYPQLIEKSVIAVGGSCYAVGIGGYIMGGGLSVIMRLYGIGSDNLIASETVLANGRYVKIDDEKQDLFFMQKGAGQGLAVMNRVQLRTYPLPEVTYDFYSQLNNWNDAEKVFEMLQNREYWASIPDRVWYAIQLRPKSLAVSGHCHGELWTLPEPLASYFTTTVYVRTNYLDSTDYWNGEPDPVGSVYGRISYVQYEPIPRSAIRTVLNSLDREFPCTVVILMDLFGGAIARTPIENRGAFPHHDAMFSWQYLVVAQPDTLKVGLDWMYSTYKATVHVMRGAYVSYCNVIIPEDQYFLQNFPRVLTLRNKYNPGKFVVLYADEDVRNSKRYSILCA